MNSLSRPRAERWLPTLLLLICFLAAAATKPAPRSRGLRSRGLAPGETAPPLNAAADLVVVVPSHDGRHALVAEGRLWRSGLRTFIVTNASDTELLELNYREGGGAGPNESYGFYPDETHGLDGKPRTSGLKAPKPGNVHAQGTGGSGDLRLAVGPFLAHAHFVKNSQDYKWMLYGDDDTMFFLPSVMRLLENMDHTVPYAITDNLWYHTRQEDEEPNITKMTHPNFDAPRCLLCTSNDQHPPTNSTAGRKLPDQGALLADNVSYFPPTLCGAEACSVELACSPFTRAGKACKNQKAPIHHGGTGIIFSRGMMEQISLASFEECMNNTWDASGGDAIVAQCLWNHGYAFTDPGFTSVARQEGRQANISVVFVDNALVRSGLGRIVHNDCDSHCVWMMQNMVSAHVSARGHPGAQAAGKAMHRATEEHQWALELLSGVAAPAPATAPEVLGPQSAEPEAGKEVPALTTMGILRVAAGFTGRVGGRHRKAGRVSRTTRPNEGIEVETSAHHPR